MTLLHDSGNPGQPGTHVLAIGVGRYPHLLGSPTVGDRPLGLRQLQSPPMSVKALLDWFFAPLLAPGAAGFVNAAAPLASVEALASAPAPVTMDTPTGPITLDPATREKIQESFYNWLGRLQAHPANIGVFYFCGHGIMVSEQYLLAEDFGKSKANPWANAFDITTTLRAVEREVPGSVFCFVDACREISREVALTLGANPAALHVVDLTKRVARKSLTAIYATGEGELAFAPAGGGISRFTAALLCAMSGYAGVKAPGSTTWNVDGEGIAAAVRQLLAREALTAPPGSPGSRQVSEQSVQGMAVPLLMLSKAPKVKVWLDLPGWPPKIPLPWPPQTPPPELIGRGL